MKKDVLFILNHLKGSVSVKEVYDCNLKLGFNYNEESILNQLICLISSGEIESDTSGLYFNLVEKRKSKFQKLKLSDNQ